MVNKISAQDLSIGYYWRNDGQILHVCDFRLSKEQRGHGRASAALQTLVQVAKYEGADSVSVSMGGGKKATKFLLQNGFTLVRKRQYSDQVKELSDDRIEGDYGVDAVRHFSDKDKQ